MIKKRKKRTIAGAINNRSHTTSSFFICINR
jgi:hypothetical protein